MFSAEHNWTKMSTQETMETYIDYTEWAVKLITTKPHPEKSKNTIIRFLGAIGKALKDIIATIKMRIESKFRMQFFWSNKTSFTCITAILLRPIEGKTIDLKSKAHKLLSLFMVFDTEANLFEAMWRYNVVFRSFVISYYSLCQLFL